MIRLRLQLRDFTNKLRDILVSNAALISSNLINSSCKVLFLVRIRSNELRVTNVSCGP